MIKALKGEDIVNRAGGRFKLTALVQQRVRELMQGSRPLVERQGRNDLEVAIAEVAAGKIVIDTPDEQENAKE